MGLKTFEYKLKTKKPSKKEGFLVCTYNYVFFNQNNKKYIVKIEEYQENLFYISFYLQSSRTNKYSVLTNDGYLRTKVNTCIEICHDIHKENDKASFCFIGAGTSNEVSENTSQTKRFRIYRSMIFSYFFLSKFEIVYSNQNNFILLVNPKADRKNLFYIIKSNFDIFD